MKLYSYGRSSTSYRVRAALNLKRVPYEIVPVDLMAGAQHAEEYGALNPSRGVPTLVLDAGQTLTQSMAILEYIDAKFPEPRLIPQDPLARARVMALANMVASDIHPVNNLRVIDQLKTRFGATPEQTREWMQFWMAEGFAALEKKVNTTGAFSAGDQPDIADICITAQVYNARRWGLDMSVFPNIMRIEINALKVPEIAAAHPDQQPDTKVTS